MAQFDVQCCYLQLAFTDVDFSLTFSVIVFSFAFRAMWFILAFSVVIFNLEFRVVWFSLAFNVIFSVLHSVSMSLVWRVVSLSTI